MYFRTAAATAFLMISTGAAVADSPVGDWLVKDGSIRVRIIDCATALWGVIAAEKTPGRDDNNRDPALRGRPMLGIPLLINLQQSEPNLWTGKIYDPKGTTFTSGGAIYDVKVGLGSKGQLEVRGCAGKVFCGGEDWTRVTDPNTPPIPPVAAVSAQRAGAPAAGKSAKASAKDAAPPSGVDALCTGIASAVPRQ